MAMRWFEAILFAVSGLIIAFNTTFIVFLVVDFICFMRGHR